MSDVLAPPPVAPARDSAALGSFLDNFGVVADADRGVVSLRQFALRLAFQGRFTCRSRLVPAVVKGEHKVLGASRGREATNTLVPGDAALAVGPADMLIPEGWEWLPLVAVARLESGHTPSRNHPNYWGGGIPWIGIRDAKSHNFGWIDSTEQTISNKGLENSSARLLPAGTVCLSRTASVGYVTIMKRSMATSQDFVNWVCSERLLPEYLMNLLRCEVPVLRRFSKGAVHQTIYFPEIKAFHIALPPLAEQKRIVAKVDQLMALCDELEAKQSKKREIGTRLTKSALEALTTAEAPVDFDRAWKRVFENFNELLDHPTKLMDLRMLIRHLAVSGRLTKQLPTDGDARVLLRQLRDEPKSNRHRHKIAGTTDEDVTGPTQLPPSWCWALFLDIASIDSNLVDPADFQDAPHVAPDNIEKGTGRLLEYRTIREDGVTSNKHRFFPGQIVYSKIRPNLSKVVAVDFEGLCSADMYPLSSRIDRGYLQLFMLSRPFLEQVVREDNRLAMPKVNQEQLGRTIVALPPLAEQKRIVTKVAQLMVLCDEVEERLTRREDAASKLAVAIVVAHSNPA